MPNNDHAKRLREMAEGRRNAARQHSDTESALLDSGLTELAQKYAAMAASADTDAAALLVGAAALDAKEPLALAAERLLAELGVTEPGAGQDNHEMPVAAMMDALYTAWNNYVRAKHGQADAIFEPEGL